YYELVTGELDKAVQAHQQVIETYPRHVADYINLGSLFGNQARYERAVEVTKQGLRLQPDSSGGYGNLAYFALALQHFDEARQVLYDAEARKLDDFTFHDARYALAFVDSDAAAMAEQQQWFSGKTEVEHFGLSLASATEAYGGHLS